ncbi:unnamed protein product [Rhizophagus irregularis]|uniref:Uncharacterized protein n=1 Tax=Rhizophagus irregularis TaxID=588596 RepID=A0A916E608_9GLOM|nr:unnamed protein product [Rhizophagus irregularis]
MAYVESLKEIILDENFTIIKFFRKINLPFIQRNQRKTKRRTEICHVRSNALNEHIIESDKIIVGKRKSTDGYPPSKRTILTSANARIIAHHSSCLLILIMTTLTVKKASQAKHYSVRDSLASKVKDIICLSNIMMIEQTKPSYFTCKSNDWNTICQRQPL